MALLLSLETSSHVCSVALHQNEQLLISKENKIPQSTASVLAPMIESALKETNHTAKELSGVVISAGPGSYTGLRIGVATAKGLCYALQIPLISVNTLELLARQFISSHHNIEAFHPLSLSRLKAGERIEGEVLLCPMLDARRMEVYCMLLNSSLDVVELTQAKIIDHESFSVQLINQPIYFFGDGSDKCKDILTHPNAHFISGILPLASSLGEMGYLKWKAFQFEDVSAYEPFYLKDFMIKKPNLI